MFRSLVVAGAALVSVSAFAADLGYKKPSPVAAVSAMCKEKKALPADAFGFATGSDVADLGAWGLALDGTYAGGYRGGRGYGYAGIVQASGSFFPCLEVGPYVSFGTAGFKPYGGVNATSSAFGGGLEMKYKVLGRATHGVGLTFAVTPNMASVDPAGPGGSFGQFGNSYRMLADAELVKGRLFGALNLEVFQTIPMGNIVSKTSQFNVRGALITPVTDSLYVGAEASYQVLKTGAWMDGTFLGAAAYVGPTFFWSINDKWTLNGTYAFQVAGTDKAGPGRRLATSVLPLGMGRLKLAYAF